MDEGTSTSAQNPEDDAGFIASYTAEGNPEEQQASKHYLE
jgi:hypothetical protein